MHAILWYCGSNFYVCRGKCSASCILHRKQNEFNPHQVPLHLIGLCETRWNCHTSSLRRVLNEVVFNSVIATVNYVNQTTSDGNVRGTAVGLLASISNLRFVISLVLLTSVLSATNVVSESLQSPNLYLLRAQQDIDALKQELRRLREDKVWETGVQTAKSLAEKLGFDDELPATR